MLSACFYFMRHIFINHLNASAGLHHSELVYLGVFFGVWSIILLITLEISSYVKI